MIFSKKILNALPLGAVRNRRLSFSGSGHRYRVKFIEVWRKLDLDGTQSWAGWNWAAFPSRSPIYSFPYCICVVIYLGLHLHLKPTDVYSEQALASVSLEGSRATFSPPAKNWVPLWNIKPILITADQRIKLLFSPAFLESLPQESHLAYFHPPPAYTKWADPEQRNNNAQRCLLFFYWIFSSTSQAFCE